MFGDASIDTLVSSIVIAALPRFSSPDKGLYIHLDIRNDKNQSVDAHLIIQRPSNYTKVFGAIYDSWSPPPPSEFKLYSDHDSCWRSDGVRFIHRAIADLGPSARVLSVDTLEITELVLQYFDNTLPTERIKIESFKKGNRRY